MKTKTRIYNPPPKGLTEGQTHQEWARTESALHWVADRAAQYHKPELDQYPQHIARELLDQYHMFRGQLVEKDKGGTWVWARGKKGELLNMEPDPVDLPDGGMAVVACLPQAKMFKTSKVAQNALAQESGLDEIVRTNPAITRELRQWQQRLKKNEDDWVIARGFNKHEVIVLDVVHRLYTNGDKPDIFTSPEEFTALCLEALHGHTGTVITVRELDRLHWLSVLAGIVRRGNLVWPFTKWNRKKQKSVQSAFFGAACTFALTPEDGLVITPNYFFRTMGSYGYVTKPVAYVGEISALLPGNQFAVGFVNMLEGFAGTRFGLIKANLSNTWWLELKLTTIADRLRMDNWVKHRKWTRIRDRIEECIEGARLAGYIVEAEVIDRGKRSEVRRMLLDPLKYGGTMAERRRMHADRRKTKPRRLK